MKDFWKKYKFWINIVSYALLLAALSFFIIKPLLSGIREKSDAIEKVKIDNQISQERIAKLPEMGEMRAVFNQEKKNLNVVLEQNNSVDFIKRLELLAQETGNIISLKIDDVSTAAKDGASSKAKKPKKDDESIVSGLPSDKYLFIEITLEGKYENFIQFLYKLENFDYYVNVLSLSLVKEEVDQSADGSGANLKKAENIQPENILVSTLSIAVYIK
ncbi:MAG: hypothetical protein CO141_00925 [Candidatus Moranbacteria bacterium CG_4_9_14_3_um_filter_42_9]|nr:MAG: hypothetical protein CO141_00925 [Candidatus Moranbacteria bacterium CG_4_9_14_3_um_filter_42_9]